MTRQARVLAPIRPLHQFRSVPHAELLDESSGFLGIGRSLTFPFPQWRAFDQYRTVFFDEGDGPAIVFLHGLGGNATHFEHVARGLVERYRVVGLDLVGFGWSQKPDIRYTIDILRDHLLSFLEQRGIRRATLVGHSMGGAVGLAAALKRPHLVDGIVLLCAAGVARMPIWMRLSAKAVLHREVLLPFLGFGAEFIVKNVFVDREQDNPYVRWFCDSSMRDEPGWPNLRDFARVAESLCRDIVERDYSPHFGVLPMPVLALWGDHDKLTSLTAVMRQLDDIKRIRTVVLHRCGHLPMVERPEETLFHIERFLASPP